MLRGSYQELRRVAGVFGFSFFGFLPSFLRLLFPLAMISCGLNIVVERH